MHYYNWHRRRHDNHVSAGAAGCVTYVRAHLLVRMRRHVGVMSESLPNKLVQELGGHQGPIRAVRFNSLVLL